MRAPIGWSGWISGVAVAIAAAVSLSVIWNGTARIDSDASAASAVHAASDPARDANIPTRVTHRGVAMQWNTYHDALRQYGQGIEEIADLGANTLLVSVAGYMEHARAQGIFIDSRRWPSPDDFKKLIAQARARNLRVIVMPIVLLSQPRGSEWRGVIEPPDWTDWWRQYEEFVIFFADLAREAGADGFTVGSELVSTEKYTSRWEEIIVKVRTRYPGRLGYSANWDHYKPVKFWDKLDFLGMTSYYTLADERNPTVESVVERWKPIRDQILDWARSTGKPLYLTEVGWCSQEGAGTAPWNYYQNMRATVAGHEEQRRLYEAFLKAWDNSAGLEGVIWWEWTPGAGGKDDFGYSPKAKPAEQILKKWFAELRDSASP